jgi:hypothetical protein
MINGERRGESQSLGPEVDFPHAIPFGKKESPGGKIGFQKKEMLCPMVPIFFQKNSRVVSG